MDRINEFLNYHLFGDGECNGILLKYYAEKEKLDNQSRLDLCYYYSITYCVESAIILLQEREEIRRDVDKWVEKNKHKIIFQSDRRYVRCEDRFNLLLKQRKCKINNFKDFNNKIVVKNKIQLKLALNCLKQWYYFSRFSSFLFLETYAIMFDLEMENCKFEWKSGDTATSGMMNLMGLDKSADYFDKNGKLPPNIIEQQLDKMLEYLIKKIKDQNGDTRITDIETSLCAYRKFFKGSRYDGYYMDRQLEEILKYMPIYPNQSKQLLEYRAVLFEKKYLGELNGWSGIRKELKRRRSI